MKRKSQTFCGAHGNGQLADSKLQLKLMTGGGEHCCQQQQHVIWEWNTSSRLWLSPTFWSEIFFPYLMKKCHQSRAICMGSITKPVHQLTQRLTKPYMIVVYVRERGGMFLMWLHPSIEDFLVSVWACCRWHVSGGLADFVSLPGL